MAFYACIVGVNQDWPEQRYSHGDIGLARCLVGQHHDHHTLLPLPKENIVELYDERATRSNILQSLESLLDSRRRNTNNRIARQRTTDNSTRKDKKCTQNASGDTLLFYYGGHGMQDEFCSWRHNATDRKFNTEPWIKHSEIIELLERKFKGGTVWCIIDCCHSGGFGQAIAARKQAINASLNVSYGCIMSVPPTEEAGSEWTMTECLIRAFTGNLSCSLDGHGNPPFYLSTKNGKHRILKNQAEATSTAIHHPSNDNNFSHSRQPSWEQVIEYLADEMARIKGNRLTTLFLGDGMEDGELLKGPCILSDTVSCLPATQLGIPRDSTWMKPFYRQSYAVNDGVVVKYVGRYTNDPAGFRTRIGWFPGRILSIHEEPSDAEQEMTTICIELYDSILQNRWMVTLPLTKTSNPSETGMILGNLPFGFGFHPLSCATAITYMARKLAYYDTSFPPGLQIHAQWKDGKLYSATSLCYHEINWEEIDVDQSLGPCVPLRWNDDHTASFVPTIMCTLKNVPGNYCKPSKSLHAYDSHQLTPMKVMMTSLALNGKTIHANYRTIVDSQEGAREEDLRSWEAYDAEDCEWSPVTLMNKVEVFDLPLKVLAYHICYREPGDYTVVHWESDSSLSVVPNILLRCKEVDGDNSSGGDSEYGFVDNSEALDSELVERYITNHSGPARRSTISQWILQVSSRTAALLRLGVLARFHAARRQ